MISTAEIRKHQAESDIQMDIQMDTVYFEQMVKRNARFVSACDEYRKLILSEVQSKLDKACDQDFINLSQSKLMQNVDGIHYTKLLYGNWDSYANCVNDNMFKANKVSKPFDLAVEELATYGYKLELTNNATKFQNFVNFRMGEAKFIPGFKLSRVGC